MEALGLDAYRDNAQRLYTISTLTDLLTVPRQRVRAWVAAGLIQPAKVEYGVWYFSFRQVSSAELSELVRSGRSLGYLRRDLERCAAGSPRLRSHWSNWRSLSTTVIWWCGWRTESCQQRTGNCTLTSPATPHTSR